MKKVVSLHSQINGGTIAQLVEQWTENPCVAGSNPAGTTKNADYNKSAFFLYNNPNIRKKKGHFEVSFNRNQLLHIVRN